MIPTEDQFTEKFVELCYSKKTTPLNMKCKYALLKLNCHYQKKEIFEDDSSIEHIIPESEGKDVNKVNILYKYGKSIKKLKKVLDFFRKFIIFMT